MIRRRPLAAAVGQALPNQQAGFGLLGIIVTAALGFAVLGVAYTVYHQTSLSADAASAAASARDIANRAQAAYASAPNFDLLNNQAMSHDRLWPGCPPVLPSQVNNPPPCPVPMNPWGAAVQVAGTASGFAVTDEQVPSASCVRLVSASATGWAGITVNGSSVMQGRTVQPSVASTLCNQAATATVQFLGGRAAGGSMPTLTPCVPGAQQSQTVACPVAGQISSVPPYGPDGITQTRTGFCNGAYGAPGWTAWQTVADTCAPACVAPAPSVTPQSQNVPASALCPGGQTGSDTWTQAQSRTQTVTYACATPVAPLTTNPATYTPWVNSGGRIGEVNTCAPMCSTILGTPPWAPQSQTVGAPGSCPPGQVATGSWTQNQTRTASCANPSAATDPVWGAWTNSGPATGTCTPACVVPPAQTQQVGCPAGQIGSITQQRTASCPAATGPATWGPWTPVSSTCTTPAPPPPPPPPPPAGPTYTSTSCQVWRDAFTNSSTVANSNSCSVSNGTYDAALTKGGMSAAFSVTCGGSSQIVNVSCTSAVGGGSLNCTQPASVGSCSCSATISGTVSPAVVAGTATITCN